jgi:hypothetical protein
MAASERLGGWDEGPQGCEALEGSARARELLLRQGTTPGALPTRQAPGSGCGKISEKASVKCSEILSHSCGAAVCGLRSTSIRKKVMGHGTFLLWRQVAGWERLRFPRRPLGPLHQPSRKHGLGAFVDPLVEKRPNLLAEIGGMSETGKFKALQRVARRREKELPRRLSSGAGHGWPPGKPVWKVTAE